MPYWKIHHRLLACFALVTLLLIALSAYSVSVTRSIDMALSTNSMHNAVIQRAAIDFRGSVHDRAIALRDLVLAPDARSATQTQQDMTQLALLYRQASAQMQQALADPAHATPPQVHALLRTIAQQEHAALQSTANVLHQLQQGAQQAAQALLWSQAKPRYVQWLASINQLIDFEEARIIANNTYANQAANEFGTAMLMITALAVVISVIAAVLLARNITRELGAEPQAVRHVVQALRNGELTVPVPVRAQDSTSVMAAVAAMQQRLHALVSTVHSNITQLRSTSGEIAHSNVQLGSRNQQTCGHLERTTQAMQALTTTVHDSAQSAQQAESLATQALEAAGHGGAVMQQVVGTMHEIANSSHRIEEIIGVIDGIAFQTNILALNAAVEAARAGEQGRGFAVVAQEVRALAGRSAEAAQQIKGLIGSSVSRVHAGNGLVAQAGSAMQDIVTHVQRVHQIIAAIGQTTQAQNQDIVQVHQSMADLERVTAQNTSLVQQSGITVNNLQSQAQTLTQLVASFTIAAAPVSAPAPLHA